jgi:hypothetical protein
LIDDYPARAYFIAVMLKFGSDLFSILRSEKIPFNINVRKELEEQLKELKQNFESIIQSKAHEHIGGQERALFGLSIYDYTLFESLYLASVIRRVQDGVSIIIGGDAVNIPTARTIVERNKDIDGAVVGFGDSILSDIMQSFMCGTEIRDMPLDGLVNATTISRYLSDPDIEQIAAKQASIIRHHMPPASVRFDAKKRKIIILSRRGCGWGLCTFCKTNVKKTFIDTDLAATKREIKRILDELSVLEDANEPVFIEFSAENNDLMILINLLIWLSNQAKKRKMKFRVWFWMTVQQFSRDIAYKMKGLKRTADIELTPGVAIESLNPVSLRNMRKGITPLQGLKALKTLHDLGGKGFSYYFTFFPLDNLDGVRKEYYFLRKSLHLISAPRTRLKFNSYRASTVDVISRNPEKYGIALNIYNDIWLNKAFNLDMPMTLMEVDYSLIDNTKEGKIVNSWFRIVKKLDHKRPSIKNKKIFKRIPFLYSLAIPLYVLPDILRHVIVQAFFRDFSYLKRNWILINLQWWMRKSLSGNGRGDSRFPSFFLKNSRLIKKYPWPFREKWSIDLTPMELEVLRYLYGPRKYNDVVAEFKMKYSKEAIREVLDRHLRLGSILRHKNMLISIFHDPGFLQTIKD